MQKGDLLGPLLYFIALKAPLQKLKQNLYGLELGSSEEIKELPMINVYLEDSFIVGNHHILHSVLEIFQSKKDVDYVLHLPLPKCIIWWTREPQRFIQIIYPPEVSKAYGDGLLVFQAPIGFECLYKTI